MEKSGILLQIETSGGLTCYVFRLEGAVARMSVTDPNVYHKLYKLLEHLNKCKMRDRNDIAPPIIPLQVVVGYDDRV